MSCAARQRWFERNPKMTLLLVMVFQFSLLLVFGEFLSRIVFPSLAPAYADRTFWTYDPLMGWAQQPNQAGTFKHPNFHVSVKFNSHGLRDKEYPLARTEKGRILVLGDSFGWGFGVEHKDIFSEVIERRNPEWEIINASVSGYGTAQQYLYLRSKGILYKPDVIILLFYKNDFWNNVHNEAYWHYKPLFVLEDDELTHTNYPVPVSSFYQKVRRFILSHSYFLPWLTKRIETLKGQFDHVLRSGESAAKDSSHNGRLSDRYEVTRRLLLKIDEQARRIRARFVVVSAPMSREESQILNAFTEKHDIAYLALDEVFLNVTEPVTFADDAHWNSVGHRVTANAVESFLKQQGLFPQVQTPP